LGLIEYGETIEQIIKIKNLSPIIAKCHVKEVNRVRYLVCMLMEKDIDNRRGDEYE
jgi:hypothetical protein